MFRVVHSHQEMFNISVTGNYFESGHGKGPCDGVGGSVKRSADRAIKQGQVIQGAELFYRWGFRQEESAVTYLLVTEEEVDEATALPSSTSTHPRLSYNWATTGTHSMCRGYLRDYCIFGNCISMR